MGKIAYQQPIQHANDATFRAWVTNLHNAIIAAGLVDPGDTGQLDLSTATRPGTHSWAGYRIYRFNDTNQGAFPVFIRLQFGTGSSAGAPIIGFTIGQGSDGSGNITGSWVVSVTQCSLYEFTTTATAVRTRVFADDGAFWFAHGLGSNGAGTAAHAFLAIDRATSSDGTPNADGIAVYYREGGGNWNTAGSTYGLSCFMIRASAGVHTCVRGSWSMVWGGVTTSTTGGVNQTYFHALPWPRVRLVKNKLTVFGSEYPDDFEFEAITVGPTPTKFVSMGPSLFGTVNVYTYCARLESAAYTLALPWE